MTKRASDVPPVVDSESAKYLSDNVAYVDSEELPPSSPGGERAAGDQRTLSQIEKGESRVKSV